MSETDKDKHQDPALAEVRQNQWRLLQVYLLYRLALAFSLVGAYFLETSQSTRSIGLDERLYFATIATYFVLALLGLLVNRLQTGRITIQIFIVIVIDILSIALLEYANGESNSNLTILLVVTVAAGGILVEGNTAAGIAFDVKGYEVAPGRQQDKVGVSRRSERVRVYVYGSSCVQ